jgi:hypothetical protein
VIASRVVSQIIYETDLPRPEAGWMAEILILRAVSQAWRTEELPKLNDNIAVVTPTLAKLLFVLVGLSKVRLRSPQPDNGTCRFDQKRTPSAITRRLCT